MVAKRPLRLSRYSELRSIGYSASEARRLRDWKGSRIESHVTERRIDIEKITPRRRTSEQKEALTNIRSYHKNRAKEPARHVTTSTRSDRLNRFKEWSKNRDFPDSALSFIIRENRNRHKPPLASFGFRLFYHRYVNGIEAIEARRRVERRDT